jgi:hypothetical protein
MSEQAVSACQRMPLLVVDSDGTRLGVDKSIIAVDLPEWLVRSA